MPPFNLPKQPASSPAATDLATELNRIATLDVHALRSHWQRTFKCSPPASLTRDLLARMLAYRVQEQHLGALKPDQRRLLDRLAQGGKDDARRLKVGTVLVRENQGVLHEVVVVADGFHWQGKTYASLSAIAQTITGTAWNGPRFFGLRGKIAATVDITSQSAPRDQPKRHGRRGAVHARASTVRATSTVPVRPPSKDDRP